MWHDFQLSTAVIPVLGGTSMLNLLIDSLRHYANERHHDVKKGSYDVTYAAKLLNTYTQSMLNGLALIGQYQQLRQAIEQECRSLHAHLGNGLTPPAFTTPRCGPEKAMTSKPQAKLTSTQESILPDQELPSASALIAQTSLNKLQRSRAQHSSTPGTK